MKAQFEYDADDSLWLRYKNSEKNQDLAVWFGGFGFKNEEDFKEHPQYPKLIRLVQKLAQEIWNE